MTKCCLQRIHVYRKYTLVKLHYTYLTRCADDQYDFNIPTFIYIETSLGSCYSSFEVTRAEYVISGNTFAPIQRLRLHLLANKQPFEECIGPYNFVIIL